MSEVIPLQPVPAQTLDVVLGGQYCTINVYFRYFYVAVSKGIETTEPIYEPVNPCFVDLLVNGAPVIQGVPGLNNNLIVRDAYLGFIGDIAFTDTAGSDDPRVNGLGSRWLLAYWPDLP